MGKCIQHYLDSTNELPGMNGLWFRVGDGLLKLDHTILLIGLGTIHMIYDKKCQLHTCYINANHSSFTIPISKRVTTNVIPLCVPKNNIKWVSKL